MKIRTETKITVNENTVLFCKKQKYHYKSNYHVTIVTGGETPKQHICHNRQEAVIEIIRQLKLAGWKIEKIRKL